MLHVALWEPRIPPNTGNVARTCAATGVALHLIGPLGFRLDDKSLKRAGCDYWPAVAVHRHDHLAGLEAMLGAAAIVCVETGSAHIYTQGGYRDGDCLLFGNEETGLPSEVLTRHAQRAVYLPMPGGAVRSINLATAVGAVVYEALRQVNGW